MKSFNIPQCLLLLLLGCRSASATISCPSSLGMFAANTPYSDNLVTLLSNMLTVTPVQMGFSYSVGDAPDQVFGLAYCNNSRSTSVCTTCADPVCKNCIETGIASMIVLCSSMKVAVGLFDVCGAGWSDRSFSSSGSPSSTFPPPSSSGTSPSLTDPLPSSPQTYVSDGGGKKGVPVVAIVVPLLVIGLVLVLCALWYFWRRKPRTQDAVSPLPVQQPQPQAQPPPKLQQQPPPQAKSHVQMQPQTPQELSGFQVSDEHAISFSYELLSQATDGFADANILGRGGFGPVYKGKLKNGQMIAVKRLASVSQQGVDELKNEVLTTKIRHKNLVRVLGYCVEDNETMLVYEFLPYSSLDRFLTDPHKCELLTWAARFEIIKGTSRGLLYLLEDCGLHIIHRDLKTSNILLDKDMSPKISDFGLARLQGEDGTKFYETLKVVGTLGYMAPEYMQGLYSKKTDIYSFGIIILEIVTGNLITSSGQNLVKNVTKNWNEGNPLKSLDARLGDVYSADEVATSMYVGLLCIRNDPDERPDIMTVVGMLSKPMPMGMVTTSRFQAW